MMHNNEEGQQPHGHHATVTLCALRYCFGRRTYMPGLVIEYIKHYWDSWLDTDKIMFVRDTKEALEDDRKGRRSIGDKCDKELYEEFVKWATSVNSRK